MANAEKSNKTLGDWQIAAMYDTGKSVDMEETVNKIAKGSSTTAKEYWQVMEPYDKGYRVLKAVLVIAVIIIILLVIMFFMAMIVPSGFRGIG